MAPSIADFGIEEANTGIGGDCEIVVTNESQSIRFIIQLKRPDAIADTTSIEGQLLHDLDIAREDDDEMVFDRCLENINDIAMSACETTVLNLAAKSQPVNSAALPSLERFLNPPTFLLQLITIDGHLDVILHDDAATLEEHNQAPLSLATDPYLNLGLPLIQASEIQFISRIHFQKVIKTHWNGQPIIFKTAFQRCERELDREIKVLHAVSQARSPKHPCPLRIPQIRALVLASDGRTIGFLANYLEASTPLSRVDIPGTPLATRARWRSQIQETLSAVHELDLVWGDVKAENVLIDGDQQAWLVDFAGSFTDGWVDRSLKETREGDLQGLRRIGAFLGV